MLFKKRIRLFVLFFLLLIFVFNLQTFSQISRSLKNKISVLKKELAKDPNNVEKLMELAEKYDWAKDPQKTIETYERVIELDPDNLEALKKLMNFYSWNDRSKDSSRMMERIIELEPDNLDIKEKLAYRYMWDKREKEAIVLFEEVVAADPSRSETRKMLADLYSWNNRSDEALDEYLRIIDTIQVPQERIDIYDKIADRYYGTRSYKAAKEYYEKILEIDPTDQEAQVQLDKINKLRRPQVFTRFDLYDIKGGYDRTIQTIGFRKWTENDYRILGLYRHSSRTEAGEDRYRYHNWEFEISKQLNETLTGYAGFGIKYYEVGKVRPEFFLSTRKNYPQDRLTFITAYSMRAEDSTEEDLGQHVNRHSLSETMYWDINKRLSLSSTLIASYFSEGDAPDDNLGLEFYFSPTYHILLENPRLDFSYTYYKAFHARKDEGRLREYEYYAPRRLDIHAVTLYYQQTFAERWQLTLSDTVDFLDGDEFDHTLRNTGSAEVGYKINEDNMIAVRFRKSKQIKNLTDDYYKDQRLTVRFEHDF